MAPYDYDLLVIGSGPGGQKAAIQAGKLGKRVALVDLNKRVGGICLHNGTVPSKSFREAILHLSGYRVREHFGEAYRVKEEIQMQDLTRWADGIVDNIEQNLRAQLSRNKVSLLCGFASFEDDHHVRIKSRQREEVLSAKYIVLATGTHPRHPPGFDFDEERILDSNGILSMHALPRSLVVVGGGIIGSEYATMFAALGVEVTIVEARAGLLSHLDRDLADGLVHHLRRHRAVILFNEKVIECKRLPSGRVVTLLESGKKLLSDVVLVSAGREGNVAGLGLGAAGVKVSSSGIVEVDHHFATSMPNIYAVGDIVGAPALASAAIEQGRRAACCAFGVDDEFSAHPIPTGIYSIPEISSVGESEVALTAAKIPYQIGIARFCDLEKGSIIGDREGVLKLLFDPETLQILGIHIIGECATELIHIGQALMIGRVPLSSVVHMVFNIPSLAQAYKVAALNGFNRMRELSQAEKVLQYSAMTAQ